MVQAKIIHVPADSSTIQGGINGAVNGDTVMVSPGTYYHYEIDFLGKAIVVMGTDPEDSSVVASTVIDANSQGIICNFHSGEDTSSILTGLTIKEGYGVAIRCASSSPKIANNIIKRNEGGGITCTQSAPTITGNIIIDNTGVDGGAINCYDSSPLITNNIITENTASSEGGGIYSEASDPTISNNAIKNNTADQGGGIVIRGSLTSYPIITDNVISENSGTSGGGINCYNSSPVISNNVITSNEELGGYGGGGIWCNGSSPTIVNCLIAWNLAQTDGGGIACVNGSSITISNCTIVKNTSFGDGGGLYFRISNPTITSSIIWENSTDNPGSGDEIYIGQGTGAHSELTIKYSSVHERQSGVSADPHSILYWLDGMIDDAPLFVDSVSGDFHLQQDPPEPGIVNPCVDTGDPDDLNILGTTRSDGVKDMGVVDMGYHYPLGEIENIPPFARIEWRPGSPEPDEPISFDASGSYDMDGDIVQYEWDWESDGVYDESYTIPTATHSWDISDDYDITLRATDDEGAFDVLTRTVNVSFIQTLHVGGGEPGHYNTIQKAINASRDQDTVFVHMDSSPYYENIYIHRHIDLVGEDRDSTIIDGGGFGHVVSVLNDSVTIDEFTVRNGGNATSTAGIMLYSNYNEVRNAKIENNNREGISFEGSSFNQVYENSVGYNVSHGIVLSEGSTENIIADNTIDNNGIIGVYIRSSEDNTIRGNTVSNNQRKGLELNSSAVNNMIYHNNIIANVEEQARDNGTNYWDNGYPSGGNYWDDYTGNDNFSGPDQDIPGPDGIWDNPHVIPDEGNRDYYPLVEPWAGAEVYVVDDSDPGFLVYRGTPWNSINHDYAWQGSTHFHPPGTGNNIVAWRVDGVITPGVYDAYAWKFEHAYLAFMATNAQYVVKDRNGMSDWIYIDQSVGGNEWIYLGTFEFDDNSTQGIGVTDNADGFVIADAIKLVYQGVF
jgi:parallel beta-helix repeat protein